MIGHIRAALAHRHRRAGGGVTLGLKLHLGVEFRSEVLLKFAKFAT